jgi:hypothetical protein
MAHNPECGLDCVSAGAVRLDNTPSADQQTGRQHLSGDQSAEYVTQSGSVRCPHCHWGFAPSVITQHIREKH